VVLEEILVQVNGGRWGAITDERHPRKSPSYTGRPGRFEHRQLQLLVQRRYHPSFTSYGIHPTMYSAAWRLAQFAGFGSDRKPRTTPPLSSFC